MVGTKEMHRPSSLIPFRGQLVSKIQCELGEGPTYDREANTVYWFDIKGRALLEWHIESGVRQSTSLPFLASALARIDDARQLIIAENGLFVRDRVTGMLSRYRSLSDDTSTRSNDSRTHPSGALWTSRMGKDARKGAGAIYHVNASAATLLYDGLTIPNGICFSPKGDIGYFADSKQNLFMRVTVDPQTGLPSGEPSMLSDETHAEGCIDGAVCDANGLIWSARWGDGSIDVHTPEGEKV